MSEIDPNKLRYVKPKYKGKRVEDEKGKTINSDYIGKYQTNYFTTRF